MENQSLNCPVSVYCGLVRWTVWFATSISVWQHIEGSRPEWCISSIIYSRDTPFWSETLDMQLSEQIHLGDTLACCLDVKQPTNNNNSVAVCIKTTLLNVHQEDDTKCGASALPASRLTALTAASVTVTTVWLLLTHLRWSLPAFLPPSCTAAPAVGPPPTGVMGQDVRDWDTRSSLGGLMMFSVWLCVCVCVCVCVWCASWLACVGGDEFCARGSELRGDEYSVGVCESLCMSAWFQLTPLVQGPLSPLYLQRLGGEGMLRSCTGHCPIIITGVGGDWQPALRPPPPSPASSHPPPTPTPHSVLLSIISPPYPCHPDHVYVSTGFLLILCVQYPWIMLMIMIMILSDCAHLKYSWRWGWQGSL